MRKLILIVTLLILLMPIVLYFFLDSKTLARWNTIYPDFASIKQGMTEAKVRQILGEPLYKWGNAYKSNCWIYTKIRIKYIAFFFEMPYIVVGPCFNQQGVYSDIIEIYFVE